MDAKELGGCPLNMYSSVLEDIFGENVVVFIGGWVGVGPKHFFLLLFLEHFP